MIKKLYGVIEEDRVYLSLIIFSRIILNLISNGG